MPSDPNAPLIKALENHIRALRENTKAIEDMTKRLKDATGRVRFTNHPYLERPDAAEESTQVGDQGLRGPYNLGDSGKD